MPETEEKKSLASEMYADLKKRNDFNQKLIYVFVGLVLILALLLAATNIYHIYQWSQFETIVVDSGEGDGNANYIQGDNSGGIYNGESSSTPEKEGQIPGDAN